ncbi:hypothetical protein ACPV5L_17450 [Vibrio astriarenae]|jgi:hypothetical protein
MHRLLTKLTSAIKQLLDFQGRVWVVNVFDGPHKGESFIVNEDSFETPYQWMINKGYNQEMIDRVSNMRPSQVCIFDLDVIKHRLMRVK